MRPHSFNLHTAVLSLIVLLISTFGPTLSSAVASAPETLDHSRVGRHVVFDVPPNVLHVALQGQHQRTGRWSDLAFDKHPSEGEARFKVPGGWRDAPLRVVVAYLPESSRRKLVPSHLATKTREVQFGTIRGANLYSIESSVAGAAQWSRISTVAAPARPKAIRVALPSSFVPGTKVRVMAVMGESKSLPGLMVPLPPNMRQGPSAFASRIEAVSGQPVREGDASLLASESGESKDGVQAANPQESDIWKVRGKKIYFFNQLRGLQIVETGAQPTGDVSPVIAGSLALPGAGEEMYLLGGDANSADSAILVTGLPWSTSSPDATRLYRVDLADDNPSEEARLDLPGYYVESRLVGGLLHVVTASWTNSSGEWSPRTHVTTVDLSQNGALVASSVGEFEFTPHSVGSTGKYFWIAARNGNNWWQHRLQAFAYKSDSSLAPPASAELAGMVQDKFKVGDTADGLAVVSMNWQSWERITSVETFREEAGSFVPAAEPLELVRGESLFATRFDGNRLYVVTFEQVDPLWIVDLSDPAAPRVRGHLEVPGWSSYIQPLGDTLLAVGRDGGRVQVSMFDVTDPDNPVRADVVDLGQTDGWSWSEAEWNEKAVKILPEAGLILVPIVEWHNGVRSNRVALVDFDQSAKTLTLQGTIDHDFAPRRAALMDDVFIASVSNRELLLVDASDRAMPVVACELTLAFGVDKALVRGETLIMIENGAEVWQGASSSAVLRTAPAGETDNILQEIPLPCAKVASAGIFGDRLVLVEKSSPAVSVWSLEPADSPALIGRIALPFEPGTDTEILPVEGRRLAVVSRSSGWRHWLRPVPMPVATDGIAIAGEARLSLPWLGWGNRELQIAVVDVAGSFPRTIGTWRLEGDGFSDISKVHSAGDLLAFSYDRRDQASVGGVEPIWSGGWSRWQTRSWLQILDLANPAKPMPWAPVELPGSLVGFSWLHRGGGVVFARTSSGIAALGFDGEFASLAAEVPVQGAITMQGATLYEAAKSGVREWTFSESLSVWQAGAGWSFEPGQTIHSLFVADGALLAGGYGLAWVLGEDGSVQQSSPPFTADLGSAAQHGSTFIVPAGAYGAVRVP